MKFYTICVCVIPCASTMLNQTYFFERLDDSDRQFQKFLSHEILQLGFIIKTFSIEALKLVAIDIKYRFMLTIGQVNNHEELILDQLY